MTVIWAVLMVVLAVIEAVTPQLVTIWFALGALASLIANLLHAPLWLQGTLFVVVSVIALIATRPLAKRFVQSKKVSTNADRAIGQTGIVQDEICNEKACGTVKVDGALWSARSADGSVIESGATIRVERIEGVKVIVIKE